MMRRVSIGVAAALLMATMAWRTSGQVSSFPAGQPLSGVTPAEFERFRVGQEDFLEVETAEEGLGPAFNGTSCAVCHSVPTVGGGGFIAEIRAGIRDADGQFRPVVSPDGTSGETLFHLFSTPGHACQPILPPEVNVIARRIPIPLFGAGLVEAIADETIAALADPDDRNRDGISGRVAWVRDLGTGETRAGRFGWKSQHASLRAFSADAYRNEMGITNELVPTELAIGISPERMRLCAPIPDPEDVRDPRTGLSALDNFEAFMKFLAPLQRRGGLDAVRVQAGAQIFGAIGCDRCHVPVLETDRSDNPLFDRRAVPLFSDLLLHDVGTGDGIGQDSALPNEIRTPALWGVYARRMLLHDGSATTLDEAIQRHANEATLSHDGFLQLDDAARAALREFLNSL